MAKLSSINKNERRKKLVKKYAGKLCEAEGDRERQVARRYRASDGAPEAGGNAAQRRIPRASATAASTGRPRAYYRKFRLAASRCAIWPTRA
jgi:small subunit ribosomal protein S14